MGLAAFRRGQRIRLEGTQFELIGVLPSGNWQLMEIDTGLRDEKSLEALSLAFHEKRLRFVTDDGTTAPPLMARLSGASTETTHACNEQDLKDALRRLQYVQAVDALHGTLQVDVIIGETWKKLRWPQKAPCLRTVQLWVAKSRLASDHLAALTQKGYRKGNRTERYSKEVCDLADEIIQTKYLKHNPPLTIAKTTEALADAVRMGNARRPASEALDVPGRRFVASRIALIPQRDRIARRYGSEAARVAMRTSLGGIKTTRALERAEIDHTLLAIVLLDDDFMPWGRASSSLCLDAHTRDVTGFANGAEVPSIVSVARCMECSLLPKTALLKKFPEVRGSWDSYGLHETYVIDNGMEEHATAFRHAASELGGSTIEFCPRKAPWFKPHVERHFRNQDLDLLQTIPGCTGENIAARPNFDPKKDLLLTRSTFEKIYMIWLVDIYRRKPQDALGKISPAEAWKRSITLEEQLLPTRRVLLERLFLKKEEKRSLDHEGVQYDCLIYNSADMAALRVQLGAKLTVDIWVSDEDLGYIYVDVPGQDISICVPCLDQHYAAGLTRWQHSKCKAMRRVAKGEGLELSLSEARDKINALVEADFAEQRHAHRKSRARYTDRGKVPISDASNSSEEQTLPATEVHTSAADELLMRRAGQSAPTLIQSNLSEELAHDAE